MDACAKCRTRSVVTIRMHVGERDLVFRSCTRCERNAWSSDEIDLTVDEVLDYVKQLDAKHRFGDA